MWPKSLKKSQKQTINKIYLPKIHHFINELLIMLENDLAEIKVKSREDIGHEQVMLQNLSSEKRTIVEMLGKLVNLISKLDKFLEQEESREISMNGDDKKIIDAFIGRIIDKN